jgi:hypothetical protein
MEPGALGILVSNLKARRPQLAGFPVPTTPDLYDLPTSRLRIIRAMRLVAVMSKSKQDHMPELDKLFGSKAAADAFMDLMKHCGRQWPDPIMVLVPCCRHTSFDEILFTDLVAAVTEDDRAQFDRLLCEMICQKGRDDLHEAFQLFVQPFEASQQAG